LAGFFEHHLEPLFGGQGQQVVQLKLNLPVFIVFGQLQHGHFIIPFPGRYDCQLFLIFYQILL
jgi:hypothetical protein